MINLSDSYKSNIPLFVSPRLLLGKIKKRNLNKSIPLHELSVIEKTYDRYIHFNMPSDFVESLSNREYANELKLFASTLINNFNDNDLYNMYLNMDTLTINNFDYDKYNSDSNIAQSLAFYKPLYNELYISDKNGSGAIYHELFHMATSYLAGNFLYSGLEQSTFDEDKVIIEIGTGINEGYTQLLAERYFKDAFKDAYILFKHQLKFVEEVIGKQLMESLYMRSDLLGFVLELRKYSTYEDISRFITYYDFLF